MTTSQASLALTGPAPTASRFKNSHNKAAYRYLLTARGIEEKAALTVRFLQVKMREYETLRAEIEQLRREAASRVPP